MKVRIFTSIIIVLSSSVVMAEDELRVVTDVFPPLVTKDKQGQFGGFDIEWMKMIAREMGREVTFQQVEGKFDPQIFEAVASGKYDCAIGGITITEDREKMGIDFCKPNFKSGLLIMVPNKTESSLFRAIGSIITPDFLKMFVYFQIYLFLYGIVFICVERSTRNPDFGKNVAERLFNAWYWGNTTSSSTGFGDLTPKTYIGKVMAVILYWKGIAAFGVIVGMIGSELVFEELKTNVSGPRDLYSKKVATITGTHSVQVLQRLGADVVEVKTIEEACSLLLREDVAAVVYDEPVLRSYAKNEGKGKVAFVDEPFEQQDYGVVVREGDQELREAINRTSLKLEKEGRYAELYARYFGDK